VVDATMDDQADRADLCATLAGDGEAFARIVRRHQGAVGRRMRRFARDAGTVEELTQEVFVQAYFSLRSYSAKAPFEHWLNVIATRVGYTFLKRRQKETKRGGHGIDLEHFAAKGSEGKLAAAEAAEALHRVMDRLSPRDRLAITLLHLENRSVAEAAELTGWSKTMVKVQAFRARANLRKLLEATA
jgi:RNA polymerase sigma-70 factor (ECF subfamily)